MLFIIKKELLRKVHDSPLDSCLPSMLRVHSANSCSVSWHASKALFLKSQIFKKYLHSAAGAAMSTNPLKNSDVVGNCRSAAKTVLNYLQRSSFLLPFHLI
jgi:hypothetical protein